MQTANNTRARRGAANRVGSARDLRTAQQSVIHTRWCKAMRCKTVLRYTRTPHCTQHTFPSRTGLAGNLQTRNTAKSRGEHSITMTQRRAYSCMLLLLSTNAAQPHMQYSKRPHRPSNRKQDELNNRRQERQKNRPWSKCPKCIGPPSRTYRLGNCSLEGMLQHNQQRMSDTAAHQTYKCSLSLQLLSKSWPHTLNIRTRSDNQTANNTAILVQLTLPASE